MNRKNTKKIVSIAMFTAIVVVLQLLGSFVRFGPFSISLTLIPIVVGAALYGPFAGAFLGLVFGLTVLLSGDAAAFLAVNPLGTVLVVLVKGALAGFLSGLVYSLLEKRDSDLIGALCASVTCPVVNTGVFLIGCLLFFLPTIREWAAAFGFENVGSYMILGLVGGNFLFELIVNLLLSPVIVRVIRMGSEAN